MSCSELMSIGRSRRDIKGIKVYKLEIFFSKDNKKITLVGFSYKSCNTIVSSIIPSLTILAMLLRQPFKYGVTCNPFQNQGQPSKCQTSHEHPPSCSLESTTLPLNVGLNTLVVHLLTIIVPFVIAIQSLKPSFALWVQDSKTTCSHFETTT